MSKWPKTLEESQLPGLNALFSANLRPLYEGSSLRVAHLELTPEFEAALLFLNGIRQLDRGLEHIAEKLAAEKKGIEALNAKLGIPSTTRISRLLLMSDGGSERLYRACERLLEEHKGRLLGIRMNIVDSDLIEKLYGADSLARVLMISHRDAVARALDALVPTVS